MNGKKTLVQNDNSMIFGNLPQRLQEKISKGVKSNPFGLTTEYGTQTQVKQYNSTIVQQDRIREDFSAQQSFVPVLESSGESDSTEPLIEQEQDDYVSKKCKVPGVLRLKASDKIKCNKINNGISLGTFILEPQHEKRELIKETPTNINETISSPRGKSKYVKPSWFEIVDKRYAKELSLLHNILVTFMQQNMVIEEWAAFRNASSKMQKIYVHLLLQHLKFCCEQKVDTFFWKLLFYNVREYLEKESDVGVDSYLLELIQDGLLFYNSLLELLNKKFLNAKKHDNICKKQPPYKYELIAKVTAQKILINLGDLTRYKAKLVKTNDYTEATKFYYQAQRLIPTNGIPYNQLAIVAIQARRKFDAIYYHMRSLLSSNEIHSARESLSVLFDELHKKYDETEVKTTPVHKRNKNTNNNIKCLKSMRKEAWVYAIGIRRFITEINMDRAYIDSGEEERLDALEPHELLREFTSLYLYMIGKFYSGVSTECLQQNQKKLLIKLKILFKREPFIFARSRMLKIVALNIFIMEHNMRKGNSS